MNRFMPRPYRSRKIVRERDEAIEKSLLRREAIAKKREKQAEQKEETKEETRAEISSTLSNLGKEIAGV